MEDGMKIEDVKKNVKLSEIEKQPEKKPVKESATGEKNERLSEIDKDIKPFRQ